MPSGVYPFTTVDGYLPATTMSILVTNRQHIIG